MAVAIVLLHVTLCVMSRGNVNIRIIDKISDNPNGALQCISDNHCCCSQNPGLREWYQPDGTLVQGTTSTTALIFTEAEDVMERFIF